MVDSKSCLATKCSRRINRISKSISSTELDEFEFVGLVNSSLPTCPLREEKSFSQRAFSIYTDIRKLQDKAETSYTLITEEVEVLI